MITGISRIKLCQATYSTPSTLACSFTADPSTALQHKFLRASNVVSSEFPYIAYCFLCETTFMARYSTLRTLREREIGRWNTTLRFDTAHTDGDGGCGTLCPLPCQAINLFCLRTVNSEFSSNVAEKPRTFSDEHKKTIRASKIEINWNKNEENNKNKKLKYEFRKNAENITCCSNTTLRRTPPDPGGSFYMCVCKCESVSVCVRA